MQKPMKKPKLHAVRIQGADQVLGHVASMVYAAVRNQVTELVSACIHSQPQYQMWHQLYDQTSSAYLPYRKQNP